MPAYTITRRRANFRIVRGNSSVRIGDNRPVWEVNVPVLTEEADEFAYVYEAYINYMVRGLNHAAELPVVMFNDEEVGRIQRTPDSSHWYTQSIKISRAGRRVQVGDNQLEIRAAPLDDPEPGNIHDDFDLRMVVVHFSYRAVLTIDQGIL